MHNLHNHLAVVLLDNVALNLLVKSHLLHFKYKYHSHIFCQQEYGIEYNRSIFIVIVYMQTICAHPPVLHIINIDK